MLSSDTDEPESAQGSESQEADRCRRTRQSNYAITVPYLTTEALSRHSRHPAPKRPPRPRRMQSDLDAPAINHWSNHCSGLAFY